MKFNKMFLMGMVLSLSSIAMASNGGDDAGNGGNNFLARAGVFQYTCLIFGGSIASNGDVTRTSFARNYLNFLGDRLPDPITNNPFYVCHDEQTYGSEDSYEYPRLEQTPNVTSLFSRYDTRFAVGGTGKPIINSIIDERMSKEYGIESRSDIFRSYRITSDSYGFLLIPFVNLKTHEYFCPSSEYSDNPYIKIITDYTAETEGLYLGEVERQVVKIPTGSREVVATLLVTESKIMKYGFFLRDGVKHRVSLASLIETDTVMFYYPYSDSMDPLVKGNRKLVVIKPNGTSPTKRLGCVFKSEK